MVRSSRIALSRAFDEARFGPVRTLDLRSGMPTAAEAVRRAEPWLRERQMAKAGEVLIVTGRGRGSPGGVGVVHEAIRKLLGTLKRKGVVANVAEHTPGSFVVSLAHVRALFETVPRSRTRHVAPVRTDPAELAALDPETRRLLRGLAERALDTLGVPPTERFVRDEMKRQFTILAGSIDPDEADRESRLRFLIGAASDAFDDLD